MGITYIYPATGNDDWQSGDGLSYTTTVATVQDNNTLGLRSTMYANLDASGFTIPVGEEITEVALRWYVHDSSKSPKACTYHRRIYCGATIILEEYTKGTVWGWAELILTEAQRDLIDWDTGATQFQWTVPDPGDPTYSRIMGIRQYDYAEVFAPNLKITTATAPTATGRVWIINS